MKYYVDPIKLKYMKTLEAMEKEHLFHSIHAVYYSILHVLSQLKAFS